MADDTFESTVYSTVENNNFRIAPTISINEQEINQIEMILPKTKVSRNMNQTARTVGFTGGIFDQELPSILESHNRQSIMSHRKPGMFLTAENT